MRILFLGGTSFVGRHAAEAALAAGHELVFFNRGETNAELFASYPHVRGDRKADAALLEGIEADAVVDTSGYTPAVVAASARAVAKNVSRYVFISSISVYEPGVEIDEESPTLSLPEGASAGDVTPETYGALKALSERELVTLLGDERVVTVRAGLMAGPHDKTDRFTYWPVRVSRGGEVLAPVGPQVPLQLIDARDVAAWIVNALATDLHGTFNVTGTAGALSLGDLLETSRTIAGGDARFTYVSEEFLEAHEVAGWSDLPLWLPDSPDVQGLFAVSTERARATGLRPRPVAATVADVLADYRTRPDKTLRAGLGAERETALLADWHAR